MSATATIETPVSVPAVLARNGIHSTETRHRFTLEEYFALESASEIRYEYDEGELIPMAGTSFEHNEIAINISTFLKTAFRGSGCRVFMEGIRFCVLPLKYRYPDVMALCNEAISDGRKPPALLNPSVVFEVISASTEEVDKGKKIEEYLHLETVTDYLLVEQEKVSVSHWSKNNEREWVRREYVSLSDAIILPSINVTLPLSEVYYEIKFDAADDAAS